MILNCRFYVKYTRCLYFNKTSFANHITINCFLRHHTTNSPPPLPILTQKLESNNFFFQNRQQNFKNFHLKSQKTTFPLGIKLSQPYSQLSYLLLSQATGDQGCQGCHYVKSEVLFDHLWKKFSCWNH